MLFSRYRFLAQARTRNRIFTGTLVLLANLSARTVLASEYLKVNDLAKLPSSVKMTAEGKFEADAAKWKIDRDADGTDLLTAKSGDETKIAAMRTSSGALEAMISYQMHAKAESSNALLFKDGKLVSFTLCEIEDAKDSIGRICVTATPKFCTALRKGSGIEDTVLKEVDTYEMRALAGVLTLRGADHQLDNTVKTGNRLGLKTVLQTTKGQIYTLAKQVAKEAKVSGSGAGAAGAGHGPASEDDEKSAKLAKTVLEKSLPRLKTGCAAF